MSAKVPLKVADQCACVVLVIAVFWGEGRFYRNGTMPLSLQNN